MVRQALQSRLFQHRWILLHQDLLKEMKQGNQAGFPLYRTAVAGVYRTHQGTARKMAKIQKRSTMLE